MLQSVCDTETGTKLLVGTTMELNMELLGDKGEPGTATVIVVNWRGSPVAPSASLMVSVAIFYPVCQLDDQH